MKVLMVTPYFYPKTGGMENYAWHIAKGLHDSYGWDVVAVAANHRINRYREEILSGIKIYRLPVSFKASNTPINLTWYKILHEIIQKESPLIINGHTPVPFISDVAARVAKQHHIPFVLTYQNDLVKDNKLLQLVIKGYYTFLGNGTGNIATKIITSSHYYPTISPYLKRYTEKIEVVSPGIDLDLYESIQSSEEKRVAYQEKKVILFVGQLDKTHMHKGLHNLIESVSQVAKLLPEVHLVVIGRGDMVKAYKKLAKQAGIANKFEIITNADNKQLVSFYKASDVTVLPSINQSEGFGLVLLEANACQKPVIGSQIGGIPFAIQHKQTGLLVEPDDTIALATALTKLLKNPKLAQKLGQNGYKRVKEEFTWDKQIAKTHKLFFNLIKP